MLCQKHFVTLAPDSFCLYYNIINLHYIKSPGLKCLHATISPFGNIVSVCKRPKIHSQPCGLFLSLSLSLSLSHTHTHTQGHKIFFSYCALMWFPNQTYSEHEKTQITTRTVSENIKQLLRQFKGTKLYLLQTVNIDIVFFTNYISTWLCCGSRKHRLGLLCFLLLIHFIFHWQAVCH